VKESELQVGKQIGQTLYIHVDSLKRLPKERAEMVRSAIEIAGTSPGTIWNVIKIDTLLMKISFLQYADFWSDPFPSLQVALGIDLQTKNKRQRSYKKSSNPPILHRKELLLPPDDPRRTKFAQLTKDLEKLGMYKNAHQIGFRSQWAKRLRNAGLRVEDHNVRVIGERIGSGSECPW